MPDSIATKPYYSPAYPFGLTDTAKYTDLAVKQLSEYPTATVSQGKEPEYYNDSPVRSSGIILLLVVAFLMVSVCYRVGVRYFRTIASNMWSVRRIKNHLDEHTARESFTMVILLSITMIMEGIIAYCAMSTSGMPPLLPSPPLAIIAAVAGATACYLVQLMVFKLLGFVFAKRLETELWVQGFNATQSLVGQILAPIALVMLFAPQHNESMLILAISLYAIARITFLIKSFRIFFTKIIQCFYFILYLCGVEIVPALLLYRACVINM